MVQCIVCGRSCADPLNPPVAVATGRRRRDVADRAAVTTPTYLPMVGVVTDLRAAVGGTSAGDGRGQLFGLVGALFGALLDPFSCAL